MKVVIAFIENTSGQLLITKRPMNVDWGGFWEFPGGKVEAHESADLALKRELDEELGIQILEYQLIDTLLLNHEFILFHVTKFDGNPQCLTGQLDMEWVSQDKLMDYEFPKNNMEFFKCFFNWKNVQI